jgi:hypothetical protein
MIVYFSDQAETLGSTRSSVTDGLHGGSSVVSIDTREVALPDADKALRMLVMRSPIITVGSGSEASRAGHAPHRTPSHRKTSEPQSLRFGVSKKKEFAVD